MYKRAMQRVLESGTRSVFLLGPRQVGKSTLLAELKPDLTLNLASPATFRAGPVSSRGCALVT